MTQKPGMIEQIASALRENGVYAALSVTLTAMLGLAAAVTRKAFTSEALVRRLEAELEGERERNDAARKEEVARLEAQRAADRAAEQEHRERIEREMHQMRDLLFTVFQHSPPQSVDGPPPRGPGR